MKLKIMIILSLFLLTGCFNRHENKETLGARPDISYSFFYEVSQTSIMIDVDNYSSSRYLPEKGEFKLYAVLENNDKEIRRIELDPTTQSVYHINNLLPNTDYSLIFYHLDTKKSIEWPTHTINFKTDTIISTKIEAIKQDQFTFSWNDVSKEELLNEQSIKAYLYKNDTLIDELDLVENNNHFKNLEPNKHYKLTIERSLIKDAKMDTSNPTQSYVLKEEIIRTLPRPITVTNLSATYEEDNHVALLIDLNNPSDLELSSFVINGELYYEFDYMHGVDKQIRLKIKPSSLGRDGIAKLEYINVDFDDQILTIPITEHNQIDVSEFQVTSVSLEEERKLESGYYNLGDELIINFNVLHQNNQTVESIVFGDKTYTTEDFLTYTDSELSIKVNTGQEPGLQNLVFKEYQIANNHQTKTIEVGGHKEIYFFAGNISQINYINNFSDFMNLDVDGINVLTSNIDLSLNHVKILPIENFSGYLEGNGYKISGNRLSNELNVSDRSYHGLFTINDGLINNIILTDSSVKVTNSGTGDTIVGSLVGQNRGIIYNSSVNGEIEGTDVTGGLVGRNNGTIVNSHADIIVRGGNGLENQSASTGGLVGSNYGTIDNSSSSGLVTSNGVNIDNSTGGLIGYNYAAVIYSHSTSEVKVTKSDDENKNIGSVGGLVGKSQGKIKNSYATGDVYNGMNTGGLVGFSYSYYGSIENSYATGNVSSASYAGGLVGNNATKIKNCYATGTVTSGITYKSYTGRYAGGLVGYNQAGGSVSFSYSTGNINIGFVENYNIIIGGLVGFNNKSIVFNSLATGDVYGGNAEHSGSVLGSNKGVLFNTFYSENQIIRIGIDDSKINPSAPYKRSKSVNSIDLHDANWFKTQLGFEELVWNLDNVDHSLPSLKN
ncbi:GLUG motif-containing protein [Haloplasma contractile]|uniref:GLUG domain protein n=1 Tax=Haloplasma contractile SSD-17B TaxID=1033810 RepID=U2EEE3_9MOLU|nr:GLUG motif-containing protein [Haloplasma contractile]ERJ13353.1 GLUG domain protein [Haloplasma contractile SSD-17B]